MQWVKLYDWMYRIKINGKRLTLNQALTYAVIFYHVDNDGIYRKGILFITQLSGLSIQSQRNIVNSLVKGNILRETKDGYKPLKKGKTVFDIYDKLRDKM